MDEQPKVKIILKKLDNPQIKSAVAAKISAFSKITMEQAQAIVEKAPVVLYKSVTIEQAKVLQQHFKNTIEIVKIEPTTPVVQSPPKTQTQPVQPKQVSKPVVAPKPEEKKETQHQSPFDDLSNIQLTVGGEEKHEETPKSVPPVVKEVTPQQPQPQSQSSLDDLSNLSLGVSQEKHEEEKPKEVETKSSVKGTKSKSLGYAPKEVVSKPAKGQKFEDNFKDVSDENGYCFDFFCENCGKKFRSEYVSRPSPIAKIINRLMNRFKGIQETKEQEDKRYWKEAFNKSLQQAKLHFMECPNCHRRVCSACWSSTKKSCNVCVP